MKRIVVTAAVETRVGEELASSPGRADRHARSASGAESGQALLIALVVLLLLGAVLAVVAGLLVSRMERVQERSRDTALLALADAAVAESLANLSAWPVSPGVERRPFGGGTIESRVTRGAGDGFTLVAEATYRGATLVVEAKGRLTELGPVVDSWRRVPASETRDGGSFEPPGGGGGGIDAPDPGP